MTFDQLKSAIKSHVNLTSQEADTRVGESINRHYRRVTSLLGMDSTRFVTRSVSTTAGVQTVTFTEIEKIDRVLDMTDSTAIRLLQEVSTHAQRAAQPSAVEPCTWAPYTMTASTVTILLDTVPQTAYSLQADGTASLADLQGNDEPAFPSSFHDVLTWFVLSEELLRKEKSQQALVYEQKAEKLLSDLRFHLQDSPTREVRQGSAPSMASMGGSGGGGGTLGGTAYTQSALVTFDLGAGAAPFAVAQADAATVTNLDADKLDGEDGSFYLSLANHTGTLAATSITLSATDRLVGRDSAGAGVAEEIAVNNGIAFNGSGAIGIENDGVTYARMQNVSAAARVLGRGGAAGSGDVEEISLGVGLSLAATTLNTVVPGSDTQVVYNDGGALGADSGLTFNETTDVLTAAGGFNTGAGGQVVFPATQNASTNANTLDDYEEGTWTPVLGGSGGTSGQTYSTQAGLYVKIGRLVTASFEVVLTAKGTITTSLQMQGLPFTVENTAGNKAVGACTWTNFWAAGPGVVAMSVMLQADLGATTAGVFVAATEEGSGDLVIAQATTTQVANTTQLRGTLVYRASA